MTILVSVFLMLFANHALFSHIVRIYPLSSIELPFLMSIALFFTALTMLFLMWITYGRASRWVLAIVLVLSSQAAYYMDQYGVIVDTVMLDNILHTNPQEFAGLVSLQLLAYTVCLGLIPAWMVLKYSPRVQFSKAELLSKLKLTGVLLILLVCVVAPFTAHYASFIREHKVARMYANPTFFSYSVIKYVVLAMQATEVKTLTQVAQDAEEADVHKHHELIIMVVGETARADRFSLNGYHRLTNPRLQKEDVVSLRNITSCGTSTGVSVPCMFSVLGRKAFDKEKAKHMENALDVLSDNGVEILWRDNNSDSKDVATRMHYEDFKTPTFNTVCDAECRDVGMLKGLDAMIASKQDKDILIVLHQMGNHGPEYYRRYPKAFEQFTPTCKSGELSTCSQQEVDNAYDNAILYTDYFLSEVIHFLQKYDKTYETAMLYVSDHGESLGEHGFYLHAAPYMIAPKEQTHVPAIVWMGKHFDYSLDQLRPFQDYPLSHDDVFCTLLVAYELASKTCDAKLPMLMANQDMH
jgi:lipid A ethanolaminephosphotransferase